MPRSTLLALLPLVLLPLVLLPLVVVWSARTNDAPDPPDAVRAGHDRPAASAHAELTAPATAPVRATAETEPWNDAALIAALAHLGEVDQVRDPRLVARSRPILEVPSRTTRTLGLARGTTLVDDPGDLSPAERGAILALGLAGATYGRPSAKAPPAVRALDRFAFVSELIQALPDLRPRVAAGLLDLMERLRLGGRPVVGPEFMQVVLEVRAAHPSLRGLLDGLLEECAVELPADERRTLSTLFVHDSADPTLVKVAFTHLLAGADTARYLELARRRLEEEGTPPQVRAAILDAVAVAAPLREAITLLAEQADGHPGAVMVHVGEREDGAEALLEAYDARLALGGSAQERVHIVAGLEGSDRGQALLDIARTDPDAGVRGRAFIACSLDPEAATTETLDAVLAGRDQPDDPFIGLSGTVSSTVLSNLAACTRRSGDVELHEQTLAQLEAAARATTAPLTDRHYALHLLRYHLDPAAHAALTDQLGLDD